MKISRAVKAVDFLLTEKKIQQSWKKHGLAVEYETGDQDRLGVWNGTIVVSDRKHFWFDPYTIIFTVILNTTHADRKFLLLKWSSYKNMFYLIRAGKFTVIKLHRHFSSHVLVVFYYSVIHGLGFFIALC